MMNSVRYDGSLGVIGDRESCVVAWFQNMDKVKMMHPHGFAVRRDNNWYEGSSGVIGDLESHVVAWFQNEQEADQYINEHECKIYSFVKIKNAMAKDYVTDQSISSDVIAWFDNRESADDYMRKYMRSHNIVGYRRHV